MKTNLCTDWCLLLPSTIGGLIGGGFALLATWLAYRYQRKHSEDNDRKLIKGLLHAINDEVETVFGRYQESIGLQIESLNDDDGLFVYYPVISDYFSVYSGNTYLIGRIPDNALRRQIVRTYTLAKSMVDSFRLNNEILNKFEHYRMLHAETQLEIHEQHMRAYQRAVIDYTQSIRQGHERFRESVENLLTTLRNHLGNV